MRVLGIDPGLNISGYGIIESFNDGSDMNIIEAGIIRTNAKAEMDNRLVEIGREFDSVLKQFEPDVMAIEELYSHFNHPKTSIIMAHARGLIIFKAAETGIRVVSYASTRIKKCLTGHGRATKEQMQKAVQTNMGLKSLPEPPDVADALAVAWCHLQAINRTEVVTV
ncbi:MAG: crossover junction endodeoxyribonuclease RuvC [candidate division Zixibacteria bacterium]|nr:crossover junction endodeoxyribonuclease RuvC [candidate division Zixibacteria bacterium]